jgi:hypothetical protein
VTILLIVAAVFLEGLRAGRRRWSLLAPAIAGAAPIVYY